MRGPGAPPCRKPPPEGNGPRIRLSDGYTHWRLEGPLEGTPIVLVHGATVPSWEFDALVPRLHRSGLRTLRFDLYGHGASDRPPGPYTFQRFTRQAIEVIESAGFASPAILLGHSFGAAVVAAVAAQQPRLASRLVLVAPMLDFSGSSGWTRLFSPPVLGELAMRLIGVPGLIRRRRRRYAAIGQPHLTPRFVAQATAPGFGRALASMFRTGALGDKSACYESLRAFAGDVLVVTGETDSIVPAEHAARVRSLLPRHSHVALAADHGLLLTHPHDVAEALRRWLQRQGPGGAPFRPRRGAPRARL